MIKKSKKELYGEKLCIEDSNGLFATNVCNHISIGGKKIEQQVWLCDDIKIYNKIIIICHKCHRYYPIFIKKDGK